MKAIVSKYSFVFVILLIVIVFHHPIIKNISDSHISVNFAPDTQYILSVLEWNQYALINEPSSLYHLNFFYPNGYVTFYGHPLFGETIIFILLNNIAGIELINTYNIYLLFAFWIGGIGIYLFASEFLKDRFGGLIAAGVYIFFPHLKQIANILNIFSFFWIGFILYFIVRYFRGNKWKDAFLAGFFISLQGLFSIYHGFFLIAVFLPVFFVFLLIFRYMRMKALLKFIISLLPFLLLLIIVFHPFLSTIQDSNLKREFDYGSLVDSNRLFRSNSTFYSGIQSFAKPDVKYFPGFISLVFFLLALTGVDKKKMIWFAALLLQFFFIYVFNNAGNIFIPNAMIIAVIIQMSWLLFRDQKITKDVRLIFSVLFAYFLIFFKFSTIFGGAEFSIYGLFVRIIPSFSNFRFLYRGVLLLVPLFAVLVSYGLLQAIRKRRYFVVLLAIFLILTGMENFVAGHHRERVVFQGGKYKSIEKRAEKVILEIPIYKPGHWQIKNSQYTINSRFHYNYYVNGRTAYRAFDSNSILFDRIMRNNKFPDKNCIKFLIENYNVNYVIFNFNKKLPFSRSDVRARVRNLKSYCRLRDEGENFIVVELVEMNPSNKFIRKYSPFHLKNRELSLKLENEYSGKVSVSILDRNAENFVKVINSDLINIGFPVVKPSIKGNSVIIRFDHDIILKKIDLIKKSDN